MTEPPDPSFPPAISADIDPSEPAISADIAAGESGASVEPAEPVDSARPVEVAELAESAQPADDEGDAEPLADPTFSADVAPHEPATSADVAPGEQDEPSPGGEEVLVSDELPDLSTDAALDAALETLLLVVDAPVTEDSLAEALEVPVDRVEAALRGLAEGYTGAGRGIDLRRAGEGWRFYTRDTYAPYVEKFLMDGQRAKLTRAALETLAVIAYRQPVTRSRVAAVRGVNVDGVIRTLLARGLVQEAGTDADTGGILYRTTELFLERLGLSSLDELPPLAPLLPEVDSIDDV